ncbi:MAG TPA: DUF1385 domain-containing protein [Ktedonobacterales bacterium]|nr:DUF1385 domain-containing protein [Ktedonobacterales bacterium]
MAGFNYGGQAVVEGVMMRGRRSAAVAVRRASGDILLHEETLDPRLFANRWLRLPFLRGLLLLWEMLVLGTRMLAFAAAASLPPDAGTDSKPETLAPVAAAPATGVPPGAIHDAAAGEVRTLSGPALALTLLFSLSFAVALFFLTPLAVVRVARPWVGAGWGSLIAEGVVRLALLVGYLWVIGQFSDVRRVFEYHGAEHKTINAFEAGQPLDIEHVRAASRVHTRCGTGFLLIVMVVSIFVFAAVGQPPLPLRVLSRIVLIPVVAAISYELLRLGAAYYRFRVVRWLVAPGLALQGLTTREPHDDQIECAIAALDRVLRRDGVAAQVIPI